MNSGSKDHTCKDSISRALYTDIDKPLCRWLQKLADNEVVTPGVVLNKDITEVQAHELEGYERVHLFAGIGGWDYALTLANWPAGVPVWTCSCPCQTLSSAKKGPYCPRCRSATLGWHPLRTGWAFCVDCGHNWHEDARHVWPEAWRLISDGRPKLVFGEQVAKVAGRDWFAGVQATLEMQGYRVGHAILPAGFLSAPHKRERLFWVASLPLADADRERLHSEIHVDGGEIRQHWGSCEEVEDVSGIVYRLPTQPRVRPLAPRVPDRMGYVRRFKGYGNAIIPQLGAAFIWAAVGALVEVEEAIDAGREPRFYRFGK